MLQTSDGETEILLGNKQLLGIFFVVVILLGVAFAGGYKVGQGSKKAALPATVAEAPATANAGVTQSVDPTPSSSSSSPAETSAEPTPQESAKVPAASSSGSAGEDAPPLGSPAKTAKSSNARPSAAHPETPAVSSAHENFTPQAGQTFLQVAAVTRDEAEGIADVLRKKGFHSHAVPKPGSKLYRVIIGPVRDSSDLNNTRASLRNTGFREIIVQKY